MARIWIIALIAFFSCGKGNTLSKIPLKHSENEKEVNDNNHAEFSVAPYDIDNIDFSKMDAVVENVDQKPEDVTRTRVRGWRIQVAVLKNFERSQQLELQLSGQLETTPHQVYKAFSPPNYSLRIGDFKTREDARKVLPLIKELGYKDAWPVRDNIYVYE